MNGFLLDTNIPSEQARSSPDPLIGAWIYAQPEESLFMSSVSIGELYKGIVLLARGRRRSTLEEWLETELVPRFSARILPVTKDVALRWGAITAERQLSGRPLAIADGLIAATALEHDLTIVTRNARDFSGLGLTSINPWEL